MTETAETRPNASTLVRTANPDQRQAFDLLNKEFRGRYGSEMDWAVNILLGALEDAVAVDVYENMRMTLGGHLAQAEARADQAERNYGREQRRLRQLEAGTEQLRGIARRFTHRAERLEGLIEEARRIYRTTPDRVFVPGLWDVLKPSNIHKVGEEGDTPRPA